MRLACAATAILAICAPLAFAQTALAPWFDADGFYNKPNVDPDRITNDLAACRIEALRLSQVRNTSSPVGTAMAFNANGTYNPVVSGAATGIASILNAIQDSRYNGSIEQVEFRDCANSLGYRHYVLNQARRVALDATEDRGFAALVSAATPAEGRANGAAPRDNYFSAALVEHAYENAPLPATPAAAAATPSDPVAMAASADEPAATPASADEPNARPASAGQLTIIPRIAAHQSATTEDGMALVVISARQRSSMMQTGGDEFQFRRVPDSGAFIDLLQPTQAFGVRAHHNFERRTDPTLAGDITVPRYSTYLIPAGRYVLSNALTLNTCLGTLTFQVTAGDVLFLGDWVLQPPGIPIAPLFNPLANINTGIDNRLKADLRVGIGDDIEAARQAMQAADDVKARLTRVSYQTGYRIPCDGRYVGRVFNPDWPAFDSAQANAFNDAERGALAQ
jgi:hypothetical protein